MGFISKVFKSILDFINNHQGKNEEFAKQVQVFRLFYRYIRPHLSKLILAILVTIPIGALDAAIAWVLKPYVDGILDDSVKLNISMVPFLIVGFTLLQGLLNYLSTYLNGWLGYQVMSSIRCDLFDKLQTLDVAYFNRLTSGQVIQGFFRDPESININIFIQAKSMLTRLISSIALAVVLFNTSWQLAIISLTVLALVLYPATFIRKLIKNISGQVTSSGSDLLSFYTDTVGGIRIIYGYNLRNSRLKNFKQYQDSMFEHVARLIKTQGWLTPSMHFIASVGVAIIIWRGSAMILSGELTAGGFVSFVAAMLMLYNPIKNLGGSILNTQLTYFAAVRILDLMNIQPQITSKPNAIELQSIQQGIEFRDVCFSYSQQDASILKHINLTIKRGETTAIVGVSGGGKTTLVNLIPRFYDINSGTILIDGVDIRDYTLESLREQIALVMQDNFLFTGTIKENLLLGKENANYDAVMLALKQAYLSDFINSLEYGLDSWIGERGIMLSGGQRQRLAIARALLKDAPVVILDEATSALDNRSEAIVQKAMETLMKDRTVIVIAHRLSTIQNADRILVIDQGCLVEQGTHEELLSYGKVYNELYQAQFRDDKLVKLSNVQGKAIVSCKGKGIT